MELLQEVFDGIIKRTTSNFRDRKNKVEVREPIENFIKVQASFLKSVEVPVQVVAVQGTSKA